MFSSVEVQTREWNWEDFFFFSRSSFHQHKKKIRERGWGGEIRGRRRRWGGEGGERRSFNSKISRLVYLICLFWWNLAKRFSTWRNFGFVVFWVRNFGSCTKQEMFSTLRNLGAFWDPVGPSATFWLSSTVH
jgi:hypothetical protein